MDKLKDEELFVTKADKGGAILILNFADVKTAIKNELFDTNKFEKLDRNAEQQLNHVKKEVKSLTIELMQRQFITETDKTLIAGLNSNNRPKLAPEYQPESPYAYPLFKVHKLSKEEIAAKKVPPNRLVHASKFGPLYRMEKWSSPQLTTISREYCKNEFILDTGDLLNNIQNINESGCIQNENINLFTLDVKALYPSIQPELALEAVRDALLTDKTTNKNTKTAIARFIELSFENSYVTYGGECYQSKIGIPTGGSLSRQIADIFLHWILFKKINPSLDTAQAIRFWKRFIDDCLGIWRGSRRSFDNFVRQLNAETMKYGIEFPINEIQFGKSVHFLDISAYLDADNTIQYKPWSKPTDSKRYLNPNSFHPRSVFNAIPFSQMLRTLRNSSKPETAATEIELCAKEFENSGYKKERLVELKQKATNRITDNTTNNDEDRETLVFPLHYFEGIDEFKKVLHSLNEEIQTLIGDDVRIMIATKKRSSIGNSVVRNKQISFPSIATANQRCNKGGCLQCPLSSTKSTFSINKKYLRIPNNLDCKSRNIIYLWLCKLCSEREAYFGRTTQESHDRTSGHRSCFTEEKWEKSALSMHAMDVHQSQFSLQNFSIAIVKKVSPQQLRREEFRFIDKYKTIPLGLNRYKV